MKLKKIQANNTKDKVLLTGGAGSIGIHVFAHIMHNTKWDVVMLDSFRHKGYGDRVVEVLSSHPEWKSRLNVIQHDLVCPFNNKLKKEIGKIDHILHLAAMSDVDFSIDNPVYVAKNNIESTLNMLEYAKETPHKTFIYFSTDEVYGPTRKGEAHPEWSPHLPSNMYAASKSACEDLCYPYWRSGDVNLIITNTMNNFAEMQSPSKFPVKIQKAVKKGEEVIIHGNKKEIGSRYYIHSRNVADALLFIINKGVKKHKKGEMDKPHRYHIVGEACVDNLELAQTIAKLMGKELKYKMIDFHSENPAHDIHYGLEDNNLRSAGWKQPLDFETSLKNTMRWQEEKPEWLNH